MEAELPLVICDGLTISGSCIPPTPSPTPTNTNTPTVTPSLTPCYNPQAYILFDAQTGTTALNSWMVSQGSTFRGMFINGPSTTFATFQSQMNSYISYSGFGVTTFILLPTPITPNQDPIDWITDLDWSATNVWVNMLVPSCAICDGGEYGLMGITDVSFNTTNATYRSFNFYYSGTSIPQGYYRLHTTYSSTGMRLLNGASEYSLSSLVCPTPTPTPSQTPNPVCPTELIITDSQFLDLPNGTYTRSSIYSGGSFSFGYSQESGGTDTLLFTTAPDGNNYPIFQYYDGMKYYTILRRFSGGTDIGFYDHQQTTNPLIVGFVPNPILALGFTTGFTTVDGIRFPPAGLVNDGSLAIITYPVMCPTPTPTSSGGTPTPTPTGTSSGVTPTPTPTNTNTPSSTPEPYCYTITTQQSAPGECFDCPGYFASTTDTIIEFFDGCSGSTITAPFNMNVIAHYSDSSTGTTYISGGTVGSVVIATSDIQCAPLPTCGEVASPTFDFLTISGGTINECCV
jgi:hypothetical protein